MEARAVECQLHAFHRGQRIHQLGGARLRSRRHLLEALGTEQRHVDRCCRDQQSLIRADVRRRLAAPNVLFARLQGQRESGLAIEIDRPADDAAWHLTHVFHARGHEPKVRSTGGQRHTQGLTIADDDIDAFGAPLARRFQDRKRHGIDHGNDQRTVRMRPVGDRIYVFEQAEEVGLLDHDRRDVLTCITGERACGRHSRIFRVRHDLEIELLPFRNRTRHFHIGRIHRRRHQDACRLRLAMRAHGHQARLGECRGSVVQRGVRDLHPREARHHRLVFIEQLQGALTRLRLIGRIGAIELATSHDRPDSSGNMVLVSACSDEIERPTVTLRARTHQAPDFHFRQCFRNPCQRLDAQLLGNLFEQRVDA